MTTNFKARTVAEIRADAATEESGKRWAEEHATKRHMALDLLEDLIETGFLVQGEPKPVLDYINSKPPRLKKSLRRLENAFDWNSEDWLWVSPRTLRKHIGLNEICLPDYELRNFFELFGSVKKRGPEFFFHVPSRTV